MTDREFEELMRTAFDRYAKEEIEKVRLATSESSAERQLAARLEQSRSGTGRRGRIAAVILAAAALCLIIPAALLFAHHALDADHPGSPTPTTAGVQTGNRDTAATTAPVILPTPTIPADVDTNGKTDEPDSIDKIERPSFESGGANIKNCDGMGEFADLSLVREELTPLDGLAADIFGQTNFGKRGGGSAVAWFGDVQQFYHFDSPVYPEAVVFTFHDPSRAPRECLLMAEDDEGHWQILTSYTLEQTDKASTVGFYLCDEAGNGAERVGYTELCLSYHYVALPDEHYDEPEGEIYGTSDGNTDFHYASYSVGNGSLYGLTTNVESLILPDAVGGYPLTLLCEGSISGRGAPNLRFLTLPEGLCTLEAGCFVGLDQLEYLWLPSTLELPIYLRRRANDVGLDEQQYYAEIEQMTDLNGDGQIGVPFLMIFTSCTRPHIAVGYGNNFLTVVEDGKICHNGVILYEQPGREATEE